MLPYYKQQTLYTCALTCLRMVLESVGRKISEYELSKIIGFNPDIGYSMPMLKDILGIINIEYWIKRDAKLEELKANLSKQLYPIVVLSAGIYQNVTGNHGHMVVVKDITDKYVIINDPDQEFGRENKEVDLRVFVQAWDKSRSWILVIKGENK